MEDNWLCPDEQDFEEVFWVLEMPLLLLSAIATARHFTASQKWSPIARVHLAHTFFCAMYVPLKSLRYFNWVGHCKKHGKIYRSLWYVYGVGG